MKKVENVFVSLFLFLEIEEIEEIRGRGDKRWREEKRDKRNKTKAVRHVMY